MKLHSQGTDSFDAGNQQRADAAQRVLDTLDADESPLDYEFCGSIQEEGEWSVAEMVKQNLDTIEIILMMDRGDTEMADGGRSYVRRQLDLKDAGVAMPSLGVPIGLLAQQGILSEDEACVNINEIAEREGWTSRNALKRIWEGVPLDCDQEPEFIE
ncbi:hypothetical protein [Halosimplex pelagicum]|uniref:Uncharacterized protein n=1 Tax=Halosimplex pelagicum TaxID=869886 RepID=A0A7D5P5J7_9EURY|nr:hypothetical protein [Halosimplex pelagicum]QLH81326.1 hypothetical protein HZS54_06660 [Halosimplex pelagicum]